MIGYITDEHERASILLNATPLACRLMKRVGGGKYELFECNEESIKLFKFKNKQEFMERYFVIYPEFQPDGSNSREKGLEIFEEAYTKGGCVAEFVFQTADGEPVPAEVTLVRLKYGDDYIIAGYTRDIRDQMRMMETIEKRDNLLNALNRVAVVLLAAANEENFEVSLLEGMKIIGRHLKSDSVQIWPNEMIGGTLHSVLKYKWLSEAGKNAPSAAIGTAVPYGERWKERLLRGEYINGSIASLPREGRPPSPGVTSAVTIPLFYREKFWGVFCVDDFTREGHYTEAEIGILHSASLMLVNAINHNLQAAQIREAHNRTQILLDTTPLAVHLWDRDRRLFYCNEETVRLFKTKDMREYLNRFDELSPKYQPDGSLSSEQAAAHLNEAFVNGKCVFEWTHRTTDDAPMPSEITLVRVAYEDDFAVAGYVRDLREQKKMMHEIEQKSNLLYNINKAANILLQSEIDEFENNLQLCMGMIGEAANADRLCIWKNSVIEGKLHCTLAYEWVADERMRTSSEISTDVPYEGNIPTFERVLSQGECLNTLTRDLSPVEQARMNMHGIKSIFVAPVFVRGEFWGFVGCDNCQDESVFSEEVVTTLRSGSLLIANALLRNEMTLNLQKTAAELTTAMVDTQKANNAKSDFLAGMSHEMRTPLNAVIGLSELMLEDGGIDEDVKANLEKIYGAGETLLSLVNDILDISKIEAGRFELVEGEYDTPSLINDTVTNNILRISEKPIEFVLNIRDDFPAQLYGDELRIKQILSNLLSNAFKYTKEGTVELGIDCAREGGAVWLVARVSDTGIGIKAEDMENLFSDYAQMDTKSNRKIEGTGLGLPIAKKMTELMDGTIEVESEYGKGTAFTIKIKQKYVSGKTIGAETAKSLKNFRYTNHKRSKNAKIARIHLPYACVLVVDDNATNLDVAKGLMKPYGMRIDTVSSGQQAIDAMRADNVKYSAVFMDHMMPGMDGVETVEKIREIGTDYAKNIPVIALTANAVAGNDKMFLSKGFQDFLSKPIDLSRLDAVIRRWVRDKSMEDAACEAEDNGSSEPDINSPILNFHFDGIDLEAGLERFGGDGDAYLQVLRSYAANTRNLLGSIKEVCKEDLNNYAITIHGIKGSSRSICADIAGEMAESLENAAKKGNFEYVSEKGPDLVQAVVKLLDDLDGMMAQLSAQARKPVKISPDKDLLMKILEACEIFDMETVEAAVKELEGFEYENDGELVHWLWENVQQFNVDEIIARLTETVSETNRS